MQKYAHILALYIYLYDCITPLMLKIKMQIMIFLHLLKGN